MQLVGTEVVVGVFSPEEEQMNPSFYMKTNLQCCKKEMGVLPLQKCFQNGMFCFYERDALKNEAYVVCFANAIMVKFIEA